MFIKNLVAGVIGVFLFPILFLINQNIFNFFFTVSGLISSTLLILFFFITVSVMEKRKTLLLKLASLLVIFSLLWPTLYLDINLYYTLRYYLAIFGMLSLGISWGIVLYELFASKVLR